MITIKTLKKMYTLANKLDQKGLYKEANVVDDLCKRALEYDADADYENPMPAPDDAELELMSHEYEDNQDEGSDREVPMEEENIEELLYRAKMLLGEREGEGEPGHDWDIFQPDQGYLGEDDAALGPELPEKQPGDKAYFDYLMKKQPKPLPAQKPNKQRALPTPNTVQTRG